MRFDALGAAGNKGIHTPNLDRLAAQGALFTSQYSSTPTCTPARSGLLQGRSPWGAGMIGYGSIAPRYAYEMPRAVRDSGYGRVSTPIEPEPTPEHEAARRSTA